MSSNFYDVLWVSKSSTKDEIKKAYRKLAMKYHPDRAPENKKKEYEEKFKEIGEAYNTLWDEGKRKQYDMFGKSAWNPFDQAWFSGFAGFEDIFSWFWWARAGNSWWFWFNFEDLFGQQKTHQSRQQSYKEPKKPESLDFEKTYEIPIFDFILWGSLEVRWVYGQTKKIKIPAWTKPWTKMRVKWFWKKEAGRPDWNLIVKLEAKMPKYISDIDKQMLERIRENIWY